MGDILRAMEEKLSPTDCITEGCCSRQERCKNIFFFGKGLDEFISEYIDSQTFRRLN